MLPHFGPRWVVLSDGITGPPLNGLTGTFVFVAGVVVAFGWLPISTPFGE
jgi:hypothetical protein